MVDAPVSGGVSRARTGQLAIRAGGDDADIERASTALEAMGSSLLRTGTAAPFAGLCRELPVAAQALLGPGADHTKFAKLSERLAGSELTPVGGPDAPAFS